VGVTHMRPAGLLQPLNIPAWKWKDISVDVIVGLPLSAHKFDSIWVIIDRFTKSAHFIPVHTNHRAENYAELYIAHILCLHGVPKTIISDRGPQFLSFLGAVACFLRDASDPQFSLSSADRWSDGESGSNS
jgi:hypothetical protein